MMKLFDSHCHLDFEPLKAELEAAVERAHKADVGKMINIGSSIRGSKASVEIANLYPNIWASVGLHPHDAEAVIDLEQTVDELRELAKDEKVVAIGEIGLDFFNDQKPLTIDQKNKQKELFIAQLQLAEELGKPLIIHTRDAEYDFLEIIRNSKFINRNSSASAVVHCFTGSPEFAKKLLDLGFYIGFTGFVTFDQPKFDHIRESAKIVPLDRLLIETDAPFLAPEPHRGKTNEPAFVVEVAKKIAELKNISLEEVAETTSKNTENLFGL